MPNWSQVLDEIEEADAKLQSSSAVDKVRRRHLKRLYQYTGRNVIAYYSGWLSNPDAAGTDVNDDDKNSFMLAIHGMEREKGLDLILHTPGGGIAAAESLVNYLHTMFGKNIRAIVPHMAMSAGTMIACTCSSIVMGKHSNLGPIDPQVNGLPAASVTKELERALKEIKEDPDAIAVWQFILSQYHPTFIDQCEHAVTWARDFVQRYLVYNMLSEKPNPAAAARAAVDFLSDVSVTKSHSRHVHMIDCEGIGLTIERLEADPKLQDAVLTVHHCFIHSLSVSGATKMVENHNGAAIIKFAA